MGMWSTEDVLGYMVGEFVVCPDCMTEEELAEVAEQDVIGEKDVEEKIAFCDRCKKKLA